LLAVRHAPRGEVNYVRLAYLLRRQNQNDPERRKENADEADRALDSLVAKNPHSYKAFLARWRYRREFDLLRIRRYRREFDLLRIRPTGTTGQVALADAAEDVAAALKREPESVEALLAAADLERL